MRVGKLSSKELNELILNKTAPTRSEVLVSAGVAEDCAAVKCDDFLLLTSDPITSACANSGRLAILISSNDIASSGGEPFACLLTIIAPSFATAEDIAEIMDDAYATASKLNIDIIGGHTEFSDSVNRTILSCTMLGKASNVVTTGGAKPFDSIVMTKTAGIEATSILANDFEARLVSGGLSLDEIAEAKAYIDNISVLNEGRIAVKVGVNSMHDITEGGVYGAVAEMCEASGLGAYVLADKIPVSELTLKICSILNIEPKRLISSGSMIMTTQSPEKLIYELEKVGICATKIGEMNDKKRIVASFKGVETLLSVTPDELLKIKR
ncbi:MAG: AIR synthase family protein [Clostridia bacterium]